MLSVRKTAAALQLPLLLLAPALSFAAAREHAPVLIPAAVGALLFALAVLPVCRGRQCVWAFLLTALGGIPLNFALLNRLLSAIYPDAPLPAQLLRGAMWGYVLFSAEEIAMVLLARLLWRRQIRLFPKYQNPEEDL